MLFEILVRCEMELEMCFPVGGGWVPTVAGAEAVAVAEAEALRSGWRRLRARDRETDPRSHNPREKTCCL